MRRIVTPFKVGVVTLAGVVALVWMVAQVKEGTGSEDATSVFALFDDASGLVAKSRVQIAGISVGEIDRIELVGGKAKVWLRVTAELHSDAAVMRKQASLLGDYYLQLAPGDATKPLLKDGERIPNVIEESGPAALLTHLERITADIERVTASVVGVLGGTKGQQALQEFIDNMNATTRAIRQSVTGNQATFDLIVGNVAAITEDVKGFSSSSGRSVGKILDEVYKIVHEVNGIVGRSKGDVGESIGTLKGTLTKLQSTLDRLSDAVANVSSIARKIDEGKGTIGKLINDDHLANELDQMVSDAGDLVHTITGMQTIVGLRGEYNFGLNSLKNYLSLRFQPREDKYYLLEIIDDPRGSTKVSRRTIESGDPQKHPLVHETETVTTDELKFSLEFAKQYHFLTGRFGIIENTGGFGANAALLNGLLDVSADIFQFGNDKNPRLRLTGSYEFFPNVYVVGGLDDILNAPLLDDPGQAFFMGASLQFADDDLKALLTTIPTPSL